MSVLVRVSAPMVLVNRLSVIELYPLPPVVGSGIRISRMLRPREARRWPPGFFTWRSTFISRLSTDLRICYCLKCERGPKARVEGPWGGKTTQSGRRSFGMVRGVEGFFLRDKPISQGRADEMRRGGGSLSSRAHGLVVVVRALLAGGGLFLFCAVVGGCGYSLTTRLPSHIKTVAVPPFQNETLEYGLEEEITQAVIEKFTTDNSLRVVSEDRADSVVYGTIREYKRRVAGFTAEEIANEYEIAIVMDIVVRDRVKSKDLWAEEGMVRTTNYFVDQVESERQGRDTAVKQLAEDIVSRTVQGW